MVSATIQTMTKFSFAEKAVTTLKLLVMHRYLSIVIRVRTRTESSLDNMASDPQKEHCHEDVQESAWWAYLSSYTISYDPIVSKYTPIKKSATSIPFLISSTIQSPFNAGSIDIQVQRFRRDWKREKREKLSVNEWQMLLFVSSLLFEVTIMLLVCQSKQTIKYPWTQNGTEMFPGLLIQVKKLI